MTSIENKFEGIQHIKSKLKEINPKSLKRYKKMEFSYYYKKVKKVFYENIFYNNLK